MHYSHSDPSVTGEHDSSDTDVLAFEHLPAVQTALRVLSRTTGLRIALVARVNDDSWTACAVLDDADFGLKPGDHLELNTTY